MNFDSKTIDVFASLNWATAEEEYEPSEIMIPSFDWTALIRSSVLPPSDIPGEQIKSDRHKNRLNKRKVISSMLASTRDDLFAGEFDR